MKVELHPEADEEFAAQVDYYEDQEVGLGLKFYHEVIAHLDWIAANATVPRLRRDHRRVNLNLSLLYCLCRGWRSCMGPGSGKWPEKATLLGRTPEGSVGA